MANNGKDTKHKSHISRRVNFVNNGGKLKNAQDWLVWGRSATGRHCH